MYCSTYTLTIHVLYIYIYIYIYIIYYLNTVAYTLYSLSRQVFRPDGSNGFNIFSESDAREEQARNRGKKVSPRMRYIHVMLIVHCTCYSGGS